jgi:hypothetical protein
MAQFADEMSADNSEASGDQNLHAALLVV